jgi:hypothetical protein
MYFDDLGAGPSHAPLAGPGESSRIFTTDWRWYYRECPRVCGCISRMRESWSSVWAFQVESRTLICRAAVVGAAMTGRLPPGPEGPLAGGAPPPERGLGGGALEAP